MNLNDTTSDLSVNHHFLFNHLSIPKLANLEIFTRS